MKHKQKKKRNGIAKVRVIAAANSTRTCDKFLLSVFQNSSTLLQLWGSIISSSFDLGRPLLKTQFTLVFLLSFPNTAIEYNQHFFKLLAYRCPCFLITLILQKKMCTAHMSFPAPFRNESIYFEVNFQQRAGH